MELTNIVSSNQQHKKQYKLYKSAFACKTHVEDEKQLNKHCSKRQNSSHQGPESLSEKLQVATGYNAFDKIVSNCLPMWNLRISNNTKWQIILEICKITGGTRYNYSYRWDNI